jgi:uncharacterized protein YggE
MKTALAAVLILCGSLAAAQNAVREPKPRTVSVRGMGTVPVAPDQVKLSVQISARAESASGAMALASQRTRDVLAILRSYGMEERNIQTSRVSVTPVFDYEKRIQPPPIVGYNGTNEFGVVFKGKLMEKVGDFLDKAVNAGAASFSGLVYEASKQRELEREALKKAAQDAQARADVLAKELGATLGKVMEIAETVTGPMPLGRSARLDAMEVSSAAPVLTGELTIIAQVDVAFELK